MSIPYLQTSGVFRLGNQQLQHTGNMSQLVGDQEKGKEVAAIFFDFKKAFDTVPHKALLDKLQELQLDGILVKWIRSYLADRKQQVVVNGATSDTVLVIYEYHKVQSLAHCCS